MEQSILPKPPGTTLIEKKGSTSGIEKKGNGNKEIVKTGSRNIVKRKSVKEQKNGNTVLAVNFPEAETVDLTGQNNDEVKSKQVPDESRDSNLNIEVTPGIQNEFTPIDSIKKDISADKNITKKLAFQEDTLADNNSKKSSIPKTKKKWNVGFFISGGISHVGNQFLGLGYSNAGYLRDPLSSGNTGGGNIILNPSRVKDRRGYVAGILLEKDVSAKTKISFGINYKEFNTSIIVGKKNDTATTGIYYDSRIANIGEQYYNNFMFIELPLRLKVQLGKSKAFPLFWSGGLTLSQLISTSALQFDPYTGRYYKDNSFFNKTQLGLSTGLSTALFQNQKTSILFGPYFYYAASQLADDGLYNKKHFVFFGLHTEILFGKK